VGAKVSQIPEASSAPFALCIFKATALHHGHEIAHNKTITRIPGTSYSGDIIPINLTGQDYIGIVSPESPQLAEELDVTNYPCPASGCLLTEVSFVPKVRDIFDHCDELKLRDFRILKIGRHFRIGERTKLIVGRDENDNKLLESVMEAGESALFWLDGNTPLGAVVGRQDPDCIDLACRILLRYMLWNTFLLSCVTYLRLNT